MFLILLMCRPLITFLRSQNLKKSKIKKHDLWNNVFYRKYGLHKYIPLDLHVSFHKTCGVMLAIFSFVHTIVHLVNLDTNMVNNAKINTRNLTYSQWLLSASPGILGRVNNWIFHLHRNQCSVAVIQTEINVWQWYGSRIDHLWSSLNQWLSNQAIHNVVLRIKYAKYFSFFFKS